MQSISSVFGAWCSTLVLVAMLVVVTLDGDVDADADADAGGDLCRKKDRAKDYCFDFDTSAAFSSGKVFNATRCGESVVLAWLDGYFNESLELEYEEAVAAWNFSTNITAETQARMNAISKNVSYWRAQKVVEATRFPKRYYSTELQDYLHRLTETASLCVKQEMDKLVELHSALTEAYSANTACFWDVPAVNACLTGADQFGNAILANSDHEVIRTIWKRYHDGAAPLRQLFTERVRLLNKGARENGFKDYGQYEWMTDMQEANFLDQMKQMMSTVMPLYVKLHAYVRFKLKQAYPEYVGRDGPIPVHLTGDLWGQSWSNIFGKVKPYVKIQDVDVTARLKRMNFTAQKMFEMSDEFFASLGLFSMTQEFWNRSMFEQPADGRMVECHASAWDFQIGDDYRIKMCTDITQEDFATIHHEMGHIQYFMAYRTQPPLYRDGANSGFHEAIGDAIRLSVLTPKHLHLIGLLDEMPQSDEYDINFLLSMALDYVAFLPFAYSLESWRWATYDGSVPESRYNTEWWRLRLKITGIAPPAEEVRGEDRFDPGAKYHIAVNVPYVRYFVSYLLVFQFYEAMCREAGHQGPLHRCDFYNSTAAGTKLLNMLSLGSSLRWQRALELMTGSNRVDSDPLLRYFRPLDDWLDKFIRENRVPIGWSPNSGCHSPGPQNLLVFSTLLFSIFILRRI